MAKQSFLMLAHDFDPKKHTPASMFLSEKLDGFRILWDGGVSKGLLASEVPWANVAKHGRFKSEVRCTGLWTRYGQPIQCPPQWTEGLPAMPLDGEATMGRGTFQFVASALRKLVPDPLEWSNVRFMIFDQPTWLDVFRDRTINETNFKKIFSGCVQWIRDRGYVMPDFRFRTYGMTYNFMKTLSLPSHAQILDQQLLPMQTSAAETIVQARMEEIQTLGGEGVMLRNQSSMWVPERSYDLLKRKFWLDAEATVVGYRWGDVTDLERSVSGVEGNKLVGLMGSLELRLNNGKTFNLSGFTMAERGMTFLGTKEPANSVGEESPGQIVDVNKIENPLFPIGSRVTFKYRELTKDGLPKEARYWRKP